MLQVVEHCHGNAEQLARTLFLRDLSLKPEDLWPLFKECFVAANSREAVQKDIMSLPDTYDAIIAADGHKLRHDKHLT